MDSIRKLVSENENNKNTFQIISHFLKSLGWWSYWKEYTYTEGYYDYARCGGIFPNGNWVEVKNVYNIFGRTNFSHHLQTYHKINVYTVLDIFVVYTSILYPEVFEKCRYRLESYAINFVNSRGLRDIWEKELQLRKSRESE